MRTPTSSCTRRRPVFTDPDRSSGPVPPPSSPCRPHPDGTGPARDREEAHRAEPPRSTTAVPGQQGHGHPLDLPLRGLHSVTEIARLTRLPVSTTHRLTAELASWQLL